MTDRRSLSDTEARNPDWARQWTYANLLRNLRDRFRLGGIPDWAASAEWLMMDALDVKRTELFGRSDTAIQPEQAALIDEWATRRLSREPLQYIVGHAEFCGLRLEVDRRVLIPRPETEFLVEQVVETAAALTPPVRVLDVGTGSGCIALAVATRIPAAEVVATDYSDNVLDLARANGFALGLNVKWTKWDLISDPEVPSFERFSILVSNPPYIPLAEAADVMPEVALYEPHSALFVDGDPLLFYRTILVAADDLLLPGGYLFFEVNPDFAVDIEHIMQFDHGFVTTGIELDLAGRQRIVWGCCDG